MQFPRRRFLQLATAMAGLPAVSRGASAQPYPSRVITIVVPLPAGGAVDTLARNLAEHMTASLGQPVVIENVSGAGGTLGVNRVARAAPDGYTLGTGTAGQYVGSQAIYQVQYDLQNDFEPVALLPDVPYWIVAKQALPVKDLNELHRLAQGQSRQGLGRRGRGRHGIAPCASCFRRAPGRAFRWCPIAAARRLCRTWWPDRSI